jgi:hypothetical protein
LAGGRESIVKNMNRERHTWADVARGGCRRRGFLLSFLTGVLLGLPASGLSQSKPPAATLATARHEYLGASVKIKGPLESSSPGLVALYMNWRIAKKDPRGRYHAVSPISVARIPYGYERHQASIIAVQWSDMQGKSGPIFDYVVKFDDGVIVVCTSSLESAKFNFEVIKPHPAATK